MYCTPSKVKVVAHPGVALTAASLVSLASFAAAVNFRVERCLGFLAGDFSSTGSTSSSCSAALESLSSVTQREVRSDSTRRSRVNKEKHNEYEVYTFIFVLRGLDDLGLLLPFPRLGLWFGGSGFNLISKFVFELR